MLYASATSLLPGTPPGAPLALPGDTGFLLSIWEWLLPPGGLEGREATLQMLFSLSRGLRAVGFPKGREEILEKPEGAGGGALPGGYWG